MNFGFHVRARTQILFFREKMKALALLLLFFAAALPQQLLLEWEPENALFRLLPGNFSSSDELVYPEFTLDSAIGLLALSPWPAAAATLMSGSVAGTWAISELNTVVELTSSTVLFRPAADTLLLDIRIDHSAVLLLQQRQGEFQVLNTTDWQTILFRTNRTLEPRFLSDGSLLTDTGELLLSAVNRTNLHLLDVLVLPPPVQLTTATLSESSSIFETSSSFPVVVFVTRELVVSDAVASPPHYNNLTLVGNGVRLVLTLSQPPADGETLTLFSFDSLSGDFGEIVVDTTAEDSCVQWYADRVPSTDSVYRVTLRSDDICQQATAASVTFTTILGLNL